MDFVSGVACFISCPHFQDKKKKVWHRLRLAGLNRGGPAVLQVPWLAARRSLEESNMSAMPRCSLLLTDGSAGAARGAPSASGGWQGGWPSCTACKEGIGKPEF